MNISSPLIKPIIYLITAGSLNAKNYAAESQKVLDLIESAVNSQISLIQIREKEITALQAIELASRAIVIAGSSKTKVLVNDRVDVAMAAKADGVHLTSASIPTHKVRQITPEGFLVGVSTHSYETALEAKLEGADFVTFGPVFDTASKLRYGPPTGVGELRRVCELLDPFPVIGLGGIDTINFKLVLANGAQGFAAIKLLNNPDNLLMFAGASNGSYELAKYH